MGKSGGQQSKYTITKESSVEGGFFGGAARWTIDIPNDYHTIDFAHSGTTGRRVVKVDDRYVIKRVG